MFSSSSYPLVTLSLPSRTGLCECHLARSSERQKWERNHHEWLWLKFEEGEAMVFLTAKLCPVAFLAQALWGYLQHVGMRALSMGQGFIELLSFHYSI